IALTAPLWYDGISLSDGLPQQVALHAPAQFDNISAQALQAQQSTPLSEDIILRELFQTKTVTSFPSSDDLTPYPSWHDSREPWLGLSDYNLA
ncbi:MAG: hypothetical protein AAF067_14540, partial [Pseudomonadota bacterium]